MNSALDSLYQDLLRQVDGNDQAKELTAEEKAENFLKEKQLVLYKLEEIAQRKLEEETRRKEETRARELERKREAAIQARLLRERREQELIREIEDKTIRFWKRHISGKRLLTGVLYLGDAIRRGDAWVPHGYGEYRVRSEVIYEGDFRDGMMHGTGRLLLLSGEVWAGHFWKDMLQGLGTLIADDESSKRKAIYWQNRRICFLEELIPGSRLQLLGDEFVRDAEGEAIIVCATQHDGQYRLRLDNGTEKVLRLDFEQFRLLRNKPHVLTLDNIVGSMKVKKLFDYVGDQVHPKTSAYRENLFYPDLRADREQREKNEKAERDLQAMRSQILAKRQMEQEAKKAADQANDVARWVEEEKQRKEERERQDAQDAETRQQALDAARAATEEKKRRYRQQ